MAKIQVLGDGFSGLSMAYFLRKAGHEVAVVSTERQGLIQTQESAYGIVESAAHAFMANALVEEVSADIGVKLVSARRESKKRFIYRKGALRRWPLSATSSLRLLAYTLPKFIFTKSRCQPKPGQSLLAWSQKQLGHEASQYLLAPALSGIYAGDLRELSASLILGKFFSKKKIQPGKLTGSVAPQKGMGQWISQMHIWLERNGVNFSSTSEEGIKTIVCLPPPIAAKYLQNRAPELSRNLAEIKMLSLVSVTIFVNSEKGISGFGCLFPREEGFRVLGILANEQIFPERAKECRSETWIFGGASDSHILALNDEEILQTISKERKVILGDSGKILESHIHRWEKAIPNYNLQLEKILPNIVPQNNYYPFGTYLGDLGLSRALYRAQEFSRSLS